MPHGDPFGSGIELAENFDLVVDEVGDIGFVTGQAELQKDLAFRSSVLLQDELGQVSTPTTYASIRVRTRRILLADDRVQSVDFIRVREGDDENEIIINATITADDDGDYELVIPVSDH